MHTIFRAFLLNIHVGCCLFSHDSIKLPHNKTLRFVLQLNSFGGRNLYNTLRNELNKRAQRIKKMRSTHACTPSFAHFSRQYSRRLLSILAQHHSQQNKNL